MKSLLTILCYTRRPVPYSESIEKLPPVADGNKYRDPQLNITHTHTHTHTHEREREKQRQIHTEREKGERGRGRGA